jgi:hypothetical protein
MILVHHSSWWGPSIDHWNYPSMWYYMISSHKQILCDSTIWDSVAAWKYTCHWLAHQGTKTHQTFAPHLPNNNERSDELMWERHGPKGKDRCWREEAKALGAWKQPLLTFLQHKLQLRTLWHAPNEDLPGSLCISIFLIQKIYNKII